MTSMLPVAFYSGDRVHRAADAETQANVQFHQKLRKIDHKSRLFSERPLTSGKSESFFAPHRIWETFATQSRALDYQRYCKLSIESRIFVVSEELSLDGKRHFVVSSFEEFWRRYTALSKEKRHFYEVIPEGHLCRLYFDLEFYKNENPDLNGIDALEVFIDLICFYLMKKFGVCCSKGNVIDLDSSTKEKFSRHLIFHIPNVVFCSNVECGSFVKYIYEMVRRKFVRNKEVDLDLMKSLEFALEEQVDPPDGADIGKLIVNNKDGKKTFLADLGVYTKNRNFRLYGSSKVGKDAYLVISNQNGFHGSYNQKRKLKNGKFDIQYMTFLDTLVCYYGKVTNDLKILTFENPQVGSGKSYTHKKEDMQQKVEEGYRLSPYPKLDEFMLTQANRGGVQGTIRRWMHFVNSNVMLYDIGKNHYCENIRRAHKSNHIYFIVDMKCGTFYQKCHDPDCVDFKSEEMALPEGVNPILNESDFLIEDFDDDSSGFLYDAVEIAECKESFIDSCFNDDEQRCETDKHVTTCCTNLHENEDFCSGDLTWESFNDDWDFSLIKENKGNGEDLGTNECRGMPYFVDDHMDVKSSKKRDSIMNANNLNSEQECNEITGRIKHADVYAHVESEELYGDMHSDMSKVCNDVHLSKCLLDNVNYKVRMDCLKCLTSKEKSLGEWRGPGDPDCQQICFFYDKLVAGCCHHKGCCHHENKFNWEHENCRNCGKRCEEKGDQCVCKRLGVITLEESSCLQQSSWSGSSSGGLETMPDKDSISFNCKRCGKIEKQPRIFQSSTSEIMKVPQITVEGQKMSTINLSKAQGSSSSKDFGQTDFAESGAFGKGHLIPSEVSNFEKPPHKNRKDNNKVIDRSNEFIDYYTEVHDLQSPSLELCHQERSYLSCSHGDSIFDKSSIRCEFSDFYLDSDLDDELMNLD